MKTTVTYVAAIETTIAKMRKRIEDYETSIAEINIRIEELEAQRDARLNAERQLMELRGGESATPTDQAAKETPAAQPSPRFALQYGGLS